MSLSLSPLSEALLAARLAAALVTSADDDDGAGAGAGAAAALVTSADDDDDAGAGAGTVDDSDAVDNSDAADDRGAGGAFELTATADGTGCDIVDVVGTAVGKQYIALVGSPYSPCSPIIIEYEALTAVPLLCSETVPTFCSAAEEEEDGGEMVD